MQPHNWLNLTGRLAFYIFYYPSHTYVALFYEITFFPQTTFARYPSRIRHNGDKGADVQQGPVQQVSF